jgi:hypothetical protein
VASLGTNGETLVVDYTTATNPDANTTIVFQYPSTCAAGEFGTKEGGCVACPIGKFNPSAGGRCGSACTYLSDGLCVKGHCTIRIKSKAHHPCDRLFKT